MIATDLNGSIQRLIRRNKIDEADKMLLKFKDIFSDDLYLEVQLNGQADQHFVNAGMVALGASRTTKIVATNDVRYYEQKHHLSHLVLRALDDRKTIKSKKFSAIKTDQRYLKTALEMKEAFKDYPSTVLTNTVEVADKCNVVFKFGGMRLPKVELPDGFKTDQDYLRYLAFDGLKKKGLADNKEYIERLEEELFDVYMVNETKGYNFARYFLMVWDYANYAQSHGCRIGVGRGCFAPGCKVDCETGIKNIEDINISDFVLSYDGKFHEVLNTLNYDADEELLEIEFEDGRIIICTKDHKIHVNRNGFLVWIRADELTKEDDIFDAREEKI
jgi:DNA polymerase-3 subunit alpha